MLTPQVPEPEISEALRATALGWDRARKPLGRAIQLTICGLMSEGDLAAGERGEWVIASSSGGSGRS